MSGAVCELSIHSPQGPRVLGRFLREGTFELGSGLPCRGMEGHRGVGRTLRTLANWRLEYMVTRNPSLPFTHWPSMNKREK